MDFELSELQKKIRPATRELAQGGSNGLTG